MACYVPLNIFARMAEHILCQSNENLFALMFSGNAVHLMFLNKFVPIPRFAASILSTGTFEIFVYLLKPFQHLSLLNFVSFWRWNFYLSKPFQHLSLLSEFSAQNLFSAVQLFMLLFDLGHIKPELGRYWGHLHNL